MRNKMRATKEQPTETAQEDFDFDAPVEGESKSDRFRRVANYRLRKSVERLRMIRQMFNGTTASNYEFTAEQMQALTSILRAEVDEIQRLMERRLARRDDNIPQL